MSSKTIYRLDYHRFVMRLRERRIKLGLSQSEIARTLGWPQQRLSAIEAGARRLDVIEFLQLTGALRLSPQRAIRLLEE